VTTMLRMQPHALMLIEDDYDLRAGLTELFLAEGYRIVAAENGLAALEQLRKGFRPSVIILDMFMPIMDGWDFRSSQLRDPELRDIPTVVLTAGGFTAESVQMQSEKVEFIPKPPSVPALLEIVARLSQQRPSELH